MDLYLVPDNPENTILLSANGTAHFRVTTMKSTEGSVTYLQRPSEDLEGGLLAEIHTVKGKKTTLSQLCCSRGFRCKMMIRGWTQVNFSTRKEGLMPRMMSLFNRVLALISGPDPGPTTSSGMMVQSIAGNIRKVLAGQ